MSHVSDKEGQWNIPTFVHLVEHFQKEKVRKVSHVLLAGSLWYSLLSHSSFSLQHNTTGRIQHGPLVQNYVQVKMHPPKLVKQG